MSNDNTLPEELQEEIKHSAHRAADTEEKRLKAKNTDYGRMVSRVHGYAVGYIAGATEYAHWKEKYEEAKELLAVFIKRHEAGLLPDRFIYNDIKHFLDGSK